VPAYPYYVLIQAISAKWLGRVMPFLNHQQARLFLTEDNKIPYGFAS